MRSVQRHPSNIRRTPLGFQSVIYRWKKSSSFLMSFLKVVGEEGFEPPTLWSQTRCATKLRYSPRRFVWFLKQGTSMKLPKLMGWLTRFELATTGITIQGSTNWAIATTNLLYNRLKSDYWNSGRWRGIRTPDPLVPNQMRYQAALFTD